MSVTITLNHDLAERLRAQAEAHELSVQQWALVILANASERPDQPETWTELSKRRLALIRKRYAAGLNALEEKELEALQDAAAKVVEPADRRRLNRLRELKAVSGKVEFEANWQELEELELGESGFPQ